MADQTEPYYFCCSVWWKACWTESYSHRWRRRDFHKSRLEDSSQIPWIGLEYPFNRRHSQAYTTRISQSLPRTLHDQIRQHRASFYSEEVRRHRLVWARHLGLLREQRNFETASSGSRGWYFWFESESLFKTFPLQFYFERFSGKHVSRPYDRRWLGAFRSSPIQYQLPFRRGWLRLFGPRCKRLLHWRATEIVRSWSAIAPSKAHALGGIYLHRRPSHVPSTRCWTAEESMRANRRWFHFLHLSQRSSYQLGQEAAGRVSRLETGGIFPWFWTDDVWAKISKMTEPPRNL